MGSRARLNSPHPGVDSLMWNTDEKLCMSNRHWQSIELRAMFALLGSALRIFFGGHGRNCPARLQTRTSWHCSDDWIIRRGLPARRSSGIFLDILSRAEWASRAATVASIWIWRLRYPKSQLRNCRTASHLWNSDLFLESLLGFVLVIRSWFTLPLVAFGRLRFNTQR